VFSIEGKTQPMCASPVDTQSSLACHYSQQPLEQLLQREDLLVAINYNSPCLPTANPRFYNCGLNTLGAPAVTEIWTSSAPIQHGSQDHCHYSQTDDALMISLVVDETAFDNQQLAIADGYHRLLSVIQQRGYPHIIRMWNYMPDINNGVDDNEHYRHFCIGRQQAFQRHHYDQQHYPSACALGHYQGDAIIYLLAAKQPGQHFENPNQQSAYQYPRQYGPQSPSFARATRVDWSSGAQLYISGTASIIGHVSITGSEQSHADNLNIQLNTTLANIDQLLTHVTQQGQLKSTPTISSLKVYLRHPEDLPAVKTRLEQHFQPETAILYTHADICRQELLLEIDGVCEL
jgi:chorismate lyase/3-hydroxybenzoate synthase